MKSLLLSMVISTVLVASSAFPFDGKSSLFSRTEWLESDDVAVNACYCGLIRITGNKETGALVAISVTSGHFS